MGVRVVEHRSTDNSICYYVIELRVVSYPFGISVKGIRGPWEAQPGKYTIKSDVMAEYNRLVESEKTKIGSAIVRTITAMYPEDIDDELGVGDVLKY